MNRSNPYCCLIKMDCFSRLIAVRAMTNTAGGSPASGFRRASHGAKFAAEPHPRGGWRVARIYSQLTLFVARNCVRFCPRSVIASVSVSEPKQSICLLLDKNGLLLTAIAVRAMTLAICLLDSGFRRNDNIVVNSARC